MSLADTRCAFHMQREAAALCQACRLAYCRECVTEDAGGMFCFRCLEARAAKGSSGAKRAWVGQGVLAAAAIVLMAAVFGFLLTWVASQPMHSLWAGWHGH